MKRFMILALVILVIYFIWSSFFATQKVNEVKNINFNEFVSLVEQGHIKSVEIAIMEISGEYTESAVQNGKKRFLTNKEYGYNVTDLLLKNKVPFKNVYKKEDPYAGIWSTLVQVLIWGGLIVIAFIFLTKYLAKRNGPGGTMGFGDAKVNVYDPKTDKNKITFKDVAGIDEVREDVEEIVDYLKGNDAYASLGGRIPRGVLLMGPSGVGKTYLAKAIACEAGVPFISFSGSGFVEMFVGVGASRVRHLFEQAKKKAPCIIFIDEIDAIGKMRGTGIGGGHDEREQALNQLLIEMDGFDSATGIILMAATNRPDILDPALLRPGRFDRKIIVPIPDIAGRLAILQVHTRKKKIDASVDLEKIARGTRRMTGADLENICNEAALNAGRAKRKSIIMNDFEEAIEKIMMGKKMNRKIEEKERENTAYHEAGHAIAILNFKHTYPLHKVSIVPRGNALGITLSLPKNEMLSVSKSFLVDTVKTMLAGRVAEEVFFGKDGVTSGAANDLERSTEYLRQMIAKLGMDEVIGLGVFDATGASPFLGRDMAMHSGASQGMQEKIENRISQLLRDYYQEVLKMISEDKRQDVEKLAKALMEKETLSAEEVCELLGITE